MYIHGNRTTIKVSRSLKHIFHNISNNANNAIHAITPYFQFFILSYMEVQFPKLYFWVFGSNSN